MGAEAVEQEVVEQEVSSEKELGENKNEKVEFEGTAEEEKSALKIQSTFRGHQVRKKMKSTANVIDPEEETQTPSEEENENEINTSAEKEINNSEEQAEEYAATKIQAAFWGHQTRKEL